METHLEPAADARELHGRSQERTAQAFSVQRVVRALRGSLRDGRFAEPHGLVGLARIHKLSAQHPS